MVEHVGTKHEVHCPHQGDNQWDICDNQPKQPPRNIFPYPMPLKTKIRPERDIVLAKRAPNNDAADNSDKRKIDGIGRRKIPANTGQPKNAVGHSRQRSHDHQPDEHQKERLCLLSSEYIHHNLHEYQPAVISSVEAMRHC